MEYQQYQIKRFRRSRRIRISVKPGGKILATAPLRTPKYLIEKFIAQQESWITQAVEKMIKIQPSQKLGTKAEYRKYKQEAKQIITQRLRELNEIYDFNFKKISIRNQSTRWGSCSRSGTLSFNYRLIFQPPEVRDYVLVHELCHLQEMNHSKKFWLLVAKHLANYKTLRRRLMQTDAVSR